MALANFSRVAARLTNKSNLGAVISVRNHWNKDFKPAPYPKTQKEREAAAKKYGIPIEQYETYPDDGLGYGDYPKLPYQSIELRDPYYPYDFPEHRRNFQEVIHADLDEISEDRQNTGRTRYSTRTMMLSFLGTMTAWFVVYFWFEDKKMFRPVLPKQFPNDGKTHYTFDPK